jgi:hypothetical protein
MIPLRIFCIITLVLFASGHAYSQTSESDADEIKANKKQSLNFEDELIEGTTQKPDLFYIFQKNNFKFKKLIKLRENFLPEMNRNAEDIQRLRGGR